VDLDERICSQVATSIAIVHVPTDEDALAIASHLARRASAYGVAIIVTKGAPLWSEVAARLGLGRLPWDPTSCALRIAEALIAQRATVIAPFPSEGSWDHAVATEIVRVPTSPWIYFTATTHVELACDRFDVAPILGEEERRRWFGAVASQACLTAPDRELVALESWWRTARSVRPEKPEIDEASATLLATLSMMGRAVRDSALKGDLGPLERAGAIVRDGEWVAANPAWRCEDRVELADGVARTLLDLFPSDPWACARAAQLLLVAGHLGDADDAQARATQLADDATVRQEIVARWMRAVDALPAGPERAQLQVRAASRALATGDVEAAFHWAKSAASSLPDDPNVTLLLGRAAGAFGDLVTARLALEAGSQLAPPALKAEYAAELAEIAYRSGELDQAKQHAESALALAADARTRLSARNTLGKLLLAQNAWSEAEQHFAEDGMAAAACGDFTAELRARVNRGIAILSNGNLEEAKSIFESVREEGERHHEGSACAFALDNLVVTAMLRRDYGAALDLAEQTFALRRRLGDRLTTVATVANVAELRRRLGLFDHAKHAVVFGRRSVSPGMPRTYATRFSILATEIALDKGDTAEAMREVLRAIQDCETQGHKHDIGLSYRLAARIALEDGDLSHAAEWLDRAAPHDGTDDARADAAILRAKLARALGRPSIEEAEGALRLARMASGEWLLREAHVLLAELHRAQGDVASARHHARQAALLRDQVAAGLQGEVRTAFLARADVASIGRLEASLAEQPAPEQQIREEEPHTQRSSSRPRAPRRELVGDDPSIRGLHLAIRKVARTDSTILIRGESGTGKELVAEAVHRASDRANGPFVAVNCAALVETLLLSELFGHERGAFTGAVARRRGRFELADQGTLFLDEIGDISPRTQVALLRVLQEKTFERVGGTTPIRANVRVICATHRDLRAMVERGEFREDLYYRLRGITLEIPPLRSRMGDLPRIAAHLLERIAFERDEEVKTLSPDAIELLERHRWPGNVRELENALRAASLFAESTTITAADLADNVEDLRALKRPISVTAAAPISNVDVASEGEEHRPLPSTEAGPTAMAYACVRQGSVSLGELKRQIERDCIARALAETRGNITRAAALLGMKRPRLSQLVKQYGLAAISTED
jgi:transcriptional regulator with GAF, ATPase, and Fis domain